MKDAPEFSLIKMSGMSLVVGASLTVIATLSLEVVLSTGKPLAHFHEMSAEASVLTGLEVHKVALAPEREVLYERINNRFDEMMAEGALEEVKVLLALGLKDDLPVMKAIGVRSLGAYLAGDCKLPEAVAKAKQETRNYAKRQMTWQRNQMADWDDAC